MAGVATGFIQKTMEVNGKPRAYAVFVPRNYDPAKAWPLIVFLHGSGERGDDGFLQTDVGIGHAIRQHPERFPCLVVMPQCPKKVWWNKAYDDIDLATSLTMKEYNVDKRRVYLTGLSMGGFATWVYGAEHVDRFAALMPICGGGRPQDAAKLAKVPIWAFHGSLDKTVDPKESRRMVEAVKKAGGDIKYTEFPDDGHNSWDDAYGDAKAIRWLLSRKK